jgi:hypothetical protein
MTLWAREDVDYVFVPVANGGCGEGHRRPVTSGVPQHFVLNCQGCENYLRADIARSGGNKKVRTVNGDYGLKLQDRYLGLWGATADTIPECPDAELAREHSEQVMITRNAASQTETLAQIGAAVAGNADLMARFLEIQMAQAGMASPQPRITVKAIADEPAPDPLAESRLCLDCSTPIIRQPGQKGALPWRCPPCKAKKNRRKAA